MSQTAENTVNSRVADNLGGFTRYLLSEAEYFSRDLAKVRQHLTDAVAGFQLSLPLPSRFFRKVEFLSNGCWLWLGSRTSGPTNYRHHQYTQIRIGKYRRTTAHRFSYLYVFGDIPENLELDHICHNKLCVNPSHLQAVSHRENCRRRNSSLQEKVSQ